MLNQLQFLLIRIWFFFSGFGVVVFSFVVWFFFFLELQVFRATKKV